MKLLRLYIENFMCHESSYIDFSQFNSALVVGKVGNNDLYSNGVGKTTVFKAIEYVLFNQADVNLEKIIRDDESSCKITIDFIVNSEEYRMSRARTRKGATDISLLQRTPNLGEDHEIYHVAHSKYTEIYVPVTSDKFWKDISGRRASDTEKDLSKLLKINFKSFRSTVHFMQNDFSGLTTATPEKRKGILKEALNLAVYSKLEKIAKEKCNFIAKDIEKNKTLIENLCNPSKDLEDLHQQLSLVEENLLLKQRSVQSLNDMASEYNANINKLQSEHALLEAKFSDLLIKSNNLKIKKNNLDLSLKDYTDKKSNLIKSANQLVSELNILKTTKDKLLLIDYDQIENLTKSVTFKKEELTKYNVYIQANLTKIQELKIPLPDDASCKHCRQQLSPEHKQNCKVQINQELKLCQDEVNSNKKLIASLNLEISNCQQIINNLSGSKKELEKINDLIAVKEKELSDKKIIHQEYADLVNKFNNELKEKNKELESLTLALKSSSKEEDDKLKNLIEEESKKISDLNKEILSLNKEITHYSNSKAVILHSIEQKEKDKSKKEELEDSLLKLNDKYKMYPSVLQAFSSAGIPNLIIQNVLDDLQIEANNLLEQLKPGLQLSFLIEKTKSDGTESDTLDINYFLGGKERQYDQLSGAQKLAVTFSLKLGLSFLLQKMIGTDVKFLLLDEIDQSLDKASVDAFADIVKFFQKDFTILVITHNDRLKDKFTHAICVEQDIDLSSRAKVVTQW